MDEYLERRAAERLAAQAPTASRGGTADTAGRRLREPGQAKPGSSEERAARKALDRLDKQLARIAEQEAALNAEIAEHAHDYERLAEPRASGSTR